jgi:hypothetical protein
VLVQPIVTGRWVDTELEGWGIVSDEAGLDPVKSIVGAIVRGFRRRCPVCGRGRVFAGLLRMNKSCPQCHFVFERGPGYFLGSTYVNYGFTAGTTTFSYVVLHFGLGIANSWLLPALLSFCAVFPVLFFPYARSLWLNLDCFFDPVSAMEGLDGSQNRDGNENEKKQNATG